MLWEKLLEEVISHITPLCFIGCAFKGQVLNYLLICINIHAGLQLRVQIEKLIFLFLNQNIHVCCGYSKEPSQWDGSFEHPKHMLKLMGKKIYTVLSTKILMIQILKIQSGVSWRFSSHQHFTEGRTDHPRIAIGTKGIASWGGSVPEILRKPLGTCDFPGGLDPLPPPLDPPMHRKIYLNLNESLT